MKNAIPTNLSRAACLAGSVAYGIEEYAAKLALPPGFADTLRTRAAEYRSADSAALKARAQHSASNTRKRAALLALADFLMRAKGAFIARFGARWSAQWLELGFPAGSVRLPRKIDDQLFVAMRIGRYLAAHPESEFPACGVTAAQAEEVYAVVMQADDAVRTCRGEVITAMAVRDEYGIQLRRQMMLARSAVYEAFGPDAAEWCEFGFHTPADPSIPVPPDAPTVQVVSETQIVVAWLDSCRARSFRVDAVDAETGDPVASLSRQGLSCAVGNLTPGSRLLVSVRARNAAGLSRPSDAAHVQMPAKNQAGAGSRNVPFHVEASEPNQRGGRVDVAEKGTAEAKNDT